MSSRAAFEVTTTDRGRCSRPGIEVRHVRRLVVADTAVVRGIPITSVARTLIDLAGVVPAGALGAPSTRPRSCACSTVRAVHAALARAPTRRGAGRLRAVLNERSPGATRSALEERFLALVRRVGLALPRTNAHVHLPDRLVEVDVLWGPKQMIVELDGAAVHRTARAFEDDRRRDIALLAAGYIVVRLTWRRVTRESDAVAREVRQLLAMRTRTIDAPERGNRARRHHGARMSDLRSAPVPPLQADDHVRGPAGAPLVVLYGDYACPRCAVAHARLRELAGEVRVVHRHLALRSKHPRAVALAHAAEAAARQDAFWPFHDALYEDPGRTDDPHLWARCERLGLDVERFEADRRCAAVVERVRGDVRGALRAGATGTPALWVDRAAPDLAARLTGFGFRDIKTMSLPTDGRAEEGQPL